MRFSEHILPFLWYCIRFPYVNRYIYRRNTVTDTKSAMVRRYPHSFSPKRGFLS